MKIGELYSPCNPFHKGEKDVGVDRDKTGEIDMKYSIFEVENHWRKGASGYWFLWYPYFSNYQKGGPFL